MPIIHTNCDPSVFAFLKDVAMGLLFCVDFFECTIKIRLQWIHFFIYYAIIVLLSLHQSLVLDESR